jgi:hypothetical protein
MLANVGLTTAIAKNRPKVRNTLLGSCDARHVLRSGILGAELHYPHHIGFYA